MPYLSDERRSLRVPCDLSVEYAVKGAPTRQGRMKNIGPTGALLTTPGAVPPVEVEVIVSFHLPLSQRPVRTLGKVRWAHQETAGVEFVHLSAQEREEIWRYYARESGRQQRPDSWPRSIRE
jgi:c-di-GMP-binding flagellar brake protein YcgR